LRHRLLEGLDGAGQVPGVEERAPEGHARRDVRRILREAVAAHRDGLVEATRAAMLLREGGKGGRRRMRLHAAPELVERVPRRHDVAFLAGSAAYGRASTSICLVTDTLLPSALVTVSFTK
jgi:hypothetical protein